MTEMSRYAPGQFCWVDLVAHDMKAAKAWYGEVFGWEARDQDTQGGPPYAMFFLRGKVVAGIGQMSDEMKAAGVPPMWNSYVSVEDAAATAARAKELGGQITVPAMKVLDAGWLAFLADPTGAGFAVWQPDRHHGAEIVAEPGALLWNELATRDPAGARAFYGSLFGWEFGDVTSGAGTPYVMARCAGQRVAGILPMGPEWGEMPPHWTVYITSNDVAASVERVQAAGGKVMVPPTTFSEGCLAVVSDPQGAIFSLMYLKTTG